MDIAAQAVAALAAPAPIPAQPQPTLRHRLAAQAVLRNATAAAHNLAILSDALRSIAITDVRDEVASHEIDHALATVRDLIKRHAPAPRPAVSIHPVGRFARDDLSCRGGE